MYRFTWQVRNNKRVKPLADSIETDRERYLKVFVNSLSAVIEKYKKDTIILPFYFQYIYNSYGYVLLKENTVVFFSSSLNNIDIEYLQ